MRKKELPGDIFVFHNGDYSGQLILTAPTGNADGSRIEAQCTFAHLLFVATRPEFRNPTDTILLGQHAECSGIRVSMEAIYAFVVQAIEEQLISILQQGVASPTREGVLSMISLKTAMRAIKAEAVPAQPKKSGPEDVDYYSEEFLEGYDDGKAGEPHTARYLEGTQSWFNYHEGWLIGDAEVKPYTKGE